MTNGRERAPEDRTGPDWCQYRRCGGKGLREVAERAVRRARVVLTIGQTSWRVCESCADLLERERRNWSRESGKVRRVQIVGPPPRSTKPPKEARKDERKPAPQPQAKKPKANRGRRKPTPLVRTKGSLAREELREAKRSKARLKKLKRTPKKPAPRPFGTVRAKAGKDAEKKRRRTEWLAAHQSEEGSDG